MGTIGLATAKELLANGHSVVIHELPSKRAAKRAKKIPGVEIIWSDLLEENTIERLAQAKPDAVIHCAVVLPPASELQPELSKNVNVGALEKLVDALQRHSPSTRLIYPSSVTVYGDCQHLPPPRTVKDPLNPSDSYSRHKIEGEDLVNGSIRRGLVLRLGVSLEPGYSPMDKESIRALFEIGLHNRLEYVHPDDVALAISNSLSRDDLWGRTLLIGGGETCRITYGELANTGLACSGIGALPAEAFEESGYYTDWMDTTESQKLLAYQRHSFADYADATKRSWRFARPFLFALRPLIRRYLLGHSRRYKAKAHAHG